MNYSDYQVTIKTDCVYYGEEATPEEAGESVRALAAKVEAEFPGIDIRYCPMIGSSEQDKTRGPDVYVRQQIDTFVEDQEYFI